MGCKPNDLSVLCELSCRTNQNILDLPETLVGGELALATIDLMTSTFMSKTWVCNISPNSTSSAEVDVDPEYTIYLN